MDLDGARDFLQQNHRAVLVTRRRDGALQASPITVGLGGDGTAVISSSEDRAKTRNLRRDPRATVCAMNDGFFGSWLQIDGTASIVSLPGAMEPLVDYYRRIAGEHPNWDEYREAMERDRRCLIRIRIERATGP